MKFLLDENLGKHTASFLAQLGYSAFRIKKIYPGAEDIEVLDLSIKREAVLITLDKDFGELIFKEKRVHTGVIFLRLDNQGVYDTNRALAWFLGKYPESKILNSFTVITIKKNKFHARILQVEGGIIIS